jgi:Carbohydrate esterase, sialic acid-specific acetylesterase
MTVGLLSFATAAPRILVILYGQSNTVNMSFASASPPTPIAGTSYYNGSSIVAPPGDGVISLLNGIKTNTGLNCIALNGAVNAVPVASLMKGAGTGYYEAMIAQVQAIIQPNDQVIIVYDQGEGDAGALTPGYTWLPRLSTIRSDIPADLGRSNSQVPLFVCTLSRFTGTPGLSSGAGDDYFWNGIEVAIADAPSQIPNTYLSHSNMDANVTGQDIHWDYPSYQRAGTREAQAISTLLGYTSGVPHWSITSAAVVDATHTTVDLTHSMGTDFTPTSGITGFTVSGDNGATFAVPTAAVRTNATTITLTHAALTTNSNRQLLYQYGINPDVSNLVADNSALAVPLLFARRPVYPTPLSVAPIPRYVWGAAATAIGVTNNQLVSAVQFPASVQKMFIISWGIQTGIAPTSITVTPNVGSPVTATLLTPIIGGPSVGIAYAVMGSDADTAAQADFQFNFAASSYSTLYASIRYANSGDLSSTMPVDSKTVSGSSVTTLSASPATTSLGFIITAASSMNYNTNSGFFSGTESFANRNDGGNNVAGAWHITGDASGVATNASSTVTANFTGSGNAAMAAASWR